MIAILRLNISAQLFHCLIFRSVANRPVEWGTGMLDEGELALFIQSYLIMLLACSSSLPYMGRQYEADKGEQLLAFVSATAHAISRRVVRDTKTTYTKSGRKAIDFQSFGDWYNSGGFRSIPWLELIDLSKWTYLPSPNAKIYPASSDGEDDDNESTESEEETGGASSGVRALERAEAEDSDEEYDNDDDGEYDQLEPVSTSQGTSFLITLHRETGSSTVSITSAVALNFLQFVTYSGLCRCPADTLWQAMKQASVDGLIGRNAFFSVMARFISAFRSNTSDAVAKAVDSHTGKFLTLLFSAFDRTGSNLADVVELMCGASLFCHGYFDCFFQYFSTLNMFLFSLLLNVNNSGQRAIS